MAQGFLDLRAALLATRPAALSLTVEDLAQRARDKKVRALLKGLAAEGLTTVDALLNEGDAMLAGRPLRKPRRAILDLVQGLVTVDARPAAGKAPPPTPVPTLQRPALIGPPGAPRVPPAPGDGASLEALLAWHRAAGATWVLSEPLRDALRDPSAVPGSVGAYLDGPLKVLDKWRQGQLRVYLSEAVRQVQSALLMEEREALWLQHRSMPESCRVLHRALVELRAELRKLTCPLLLERRGLTIELAGGLEPSASIRWRDPARRARATLPLLTRPLSRKHLQVDAPATEASVLALALVDSLLRILADPAHDLAEPLEALLTTPAWQRGLQSILDHLPEPTPQRLVWAVAADRLAVSRVRMGQRGWLKPEPVTVDTLRSDVHATPRDHEALDLLDQYPDLRRQRVMADPGAVLLARILAILEGHPDLVSLDDPTLHLTVRRAPIEARLVRDGEALVIRPFFADAVRTWAEQDDLLARAEHGATGLWFEGGDCWLVSLPLPVTHALVTARRYELSLAPADVPAAMPMLMTLVERLGLDLDPSLGRPVSCPGRLRLRLTPEGPDGAWVELRIELDPGLPTFVPGEGPEHLPVVGADGVRILARDRAAERSGASLLATALGLGPAGYLRLLSARDALAVVAAAELRDDVTVELPQEGWQPRRAGLEQLSLQAVERKGGFTLDGALEVDGTEVALAVLLEARRRDERFVALGEGRWARLDDALTDALDEAAPGLETRKTTVAVVPAGLRQAEGLLASASGAPRPATWQARLQRLAEAADLEPELPGELQADLRPYQAAGFAWMMRLAHLGLGAVLADEMGLGKTVQTIAVLTARGAAGPALVVTPTSVSHGWLRELGRFAPTLDARLYRGPARAALLRDLGPGAVLITSYDLLVRDVEALAALPFATVVLDEAQAIKNPGARRSQAARALQAGFRLALTGTPIENDVQDLWSVLDAISPGLLGQREAFLGRFGPVPGDARATGLRLERLARLVQPFLLRRTKRAVAPELPERTVVRVDVALSAPERALYRSVHAAAVREISEAVVPGLEADRRFQVLAALTRLRQLACHPRLYQRDSALPSAKHERLMGLLEALLAAGQRALVFSQFVRQLDLLQEALRRAGIPFLVLTGSTPASERARRVEAFQAGEGAVFLISLKAGGTGLNLTEADAVIHMDPWWNPAAEDQASDRAHRIGRRRPVTIYRLVAEGTIEAAIVDLQDDKRATADAVLGGASAGAKLTTEDLAALIRAGLDDPDADDA